MANLTTTTAATTGYAATREGTAVLERAQAGLLELSDADRVDFLQRMTTNNMVTLCPGQSAVTVLTSPTARILYVFTVLCRAEALWLLPAPGQTSALERHLRRNIFFMDKVKVRNLTETVGRVRIVGPQAAAALTAAGLPAAGLVDDAWMEAGNLTLLRQERYDLPGFEAILPVAEMENLLQQLQAAGAQPLDDDAYHKRRVELGRPAPGAELVEEFNPLEAGLAWACAENKGCYTGQEIIARQLTYDKVTRTLVGLRSAQAMAAGAEVMADGRNAGVVTSAVHSTRLNAPIALAVVKRPHNQPGSQVTVAGVAAQVVALPFADAV